jgi:hypothetical protein
MKYELVKDLPDLKAGVVFDTERGNSQDFVYRNPDDKEWLYTLEMIQSSDFFRPYNEPFAVVPLIRQSKALLRERHAGDPYFYYVKLTKQVDQADLEAVVMDAIISGDLKSTDV